MTQPADWSRVISVWNLIRIMHVCIDEISDMWCRRYSNTLYALFICEKQSPVIVAFYAWGVERCGVVAATAVHGMRKPSIADLTLNSRLSTFSGSSSEEWTLLLFHCYEWLLKCEVGSISLQPLQSVGSNDLESVDFSQQFYSRPNWQLQLSASRNSPTELNWTFGTSRQYLVKSMSAVDVWKCWDSALGHEGCLAANSTSTGPQQQNADDRNRSVGSTSPGLSQSRLYTGTTIVNNFFQIPGAESWSVSWSAVAITAVGASS